jgi:hypothetical protein
MNSACANNCQTVLYLLSFLVFSIILHRRLSKTCRKLANKTWQRKSYRKFKTHILSLFARSQQAFSAASIKKSNLLYWILGKLFYPEQFSNWKTFQRGDKICVLNKVAHKLYSEVNRTCWRYLFYVSIFYFWTTFSSTSKPGTPSLFHCCYLTLKNPRKYVVLVLLSVGRCLWFCVEGWHKQLYLFHIL